MSIPYRTGFGEVGPKESVASQRFLGQLLACVAASAHSPARSPPAKPPIISGTQAMREIHRNLL
jgi:hypothetical protein